MEDEVKGVSGVRADSDSEARDGGASLNASARGDDVPGTEGGRWHAAGGMDMKHLRR